MAKLRNYVCDLPTIYFLLIVHLIVNCPQSKLTKLHKKTLLPKGKHQNLGSSLYTLNRVPGNKISHPTIFRILTKESDEATNIPRYNHNLIMATCKNEFVEVDREDICNGIDIRRTDQRNGDQIFEKFQGRIMQLEELKESLFNYTSDVRALASKFQNFKHLNRIHINHNHRSQDMCHLSGDFTIDNDILDFLEHCRNYAEPVQTCSHKLDCSSTEKIGIITETLTKLHESILEKVGEMISKLDAEHDTRIKNTSQESIDQLMKDMFIPVSDVIIERRATQSSTMFTQHMQEFSCLADIRDDENISDSDHVSFEEII